MKASLEQRMERAKRLAELPFEVRNWSVADVELRETNGGQLLEFSGYAAVFNTPYEVQDWYGTYTEEVLEGAFTKTLREKDDVRFLINHDGLPVARTKSGTLELSQDAIGLLTKAGLEPSDPDVQRMKPKMLRKDLDEMSYAFLATRQEWNEDYTYRKLIECKLFDVSVVTYPANPATSATLRTSDMIAALAQLEQDELVAELRGAKSPVARAAVESLQRAFAQILEGSEIIESDDTQVVPLAIRQRELELLRAIA